MPPDESLLESLPHRLRERLEGRLADGEQLVWVGRPNAGRVFRIELSRAAFSHFFPLFVGTGLVAIGVLWPAANPGVPFAPWLWWVAWGALGLTTLSVGMHAFGARRRARRTVYAVTDRRALVCRDLLFARDRSHEREAISTVRARTRPGGRGEIVFEPPEGSAWPRSADQEATGFLDLDDAVAARRAVERMLGREIPEENFGRAAEEKSTRPYVEGADDLPGPLRDRLCGELAEGERILWLGRPPPGVMVLRAAVTGGCSFLAITGCIGGVAAFVAAAGWVFGMPGAGLARWVVVGLAVLTALAAVLGVVGAWYGSRRAAYVITDRRALLVLVGMGGRVFSYGRTALDQLQVRVLKDGSGEIIFEEHTRVYPTESGSDERYTYVVGFIEVKPVEPARLALEQMLGRPVPATPVETVSLNQHHPI